MEHKSITSRILWQSACAAVCAGAAGAAGAETIAFVASYTNASYTADTIALLQTAGHTVTVVPAGEVSGLLSQTHTASGLTRKAYLETFNLVLISRASSSGDYTDKAGWAAIEVPVISMNGYAVRSSRLGWFSLEQSDQGPADPDTIVTLPTHPIWADDTLMGSNTSPLTAAGDIALPSLSRPLSSGTGIHEEGSLRSWRSYDGLLTMFALLEVSGKFRIHPPQNDSSDGPRAD